MYSLRVSVMVFLIIGALMAKFDKGDALKCRVCSSERDKQCSDDPNSIEPTECGGGTTSPSTTATVPPATEPTIPSTTATVPPATEPTTPSTTTTVPPATEPTTPSTTTTVQPATEPTTPSTTTTVPPATEPTTPSTTTTVPPATESTTPSTTTTVKPATEPTTPSTTTTTVPPVTETTTPSTTTTEQSVNDENDKLGGTKKGREISSRFKREALESRASQSEYTCYKLTYQSATTIVERGCALKNENTCANLKENKSNAECDLCAEDGCNASARVSLQIMSMILPVTLAIIFAR